MKEIIGSVSARGESTRKIDNDMIRIVVTHRLDTEDVKNKGRELVTRINEESMKFNKYLEDVNIDKMNPTGTAVETSLSGPYEKYTGSGYERIMSGYYAYITSTINIESKYASDIIQYISDFTSSESKITINNYFYLSNKMRSLIEKKNIKDATADAIHNAKLAYEVAYGSKYQYEITKIQINNSNNTFVPYYKSGSQMAMEVSGDIVQSGQDEIKTTVDVILSYYEKKQPNCC